MTLSITSIALPSDGYVRLSPRVWTWHVCALFCMLFFTSFSAFDLGFSALFFDGSRFAAADNLFLEIVRKFIWKTTVLTALVCLIGAGLGQCGHAFLGIPSERWRYAILLILSGPLVIVNLGLKTFWGRARPADITEFGGSLGFTPALVPTDQCARNCSFVSGEGSGAVTFAIVVWVLTEDVSRPKVRMGLRLTAVLLAFTGSLLRVVTGRHFVSDIVFALLIVTGVALVLRPMLSRPFRLRGQ